MTTLEQFKGFLNTKDISTAKDGKLKSFEFPEIEITDALLADLDNLDHPRNSVLGKRMESFFEIAIKHSRRYSFTASNIQVIENKRTIGELDFLVFDKLSERTIHVELVYKLYVYDDSFALEKDRWIGPNRRDSFSEKLDKLNSRQFPLLYRPETVSYLRDLNLKPEEIDQQLCFKAQLFLPGDTNIDQSGFINPNCFTGQWLTLEDFKDSGWDKNLFFSPQKKDWSCDPTHNSKWFSQKELLETTEFLFERKNTPLVWMKNGNSIYRFFIVWW